MRIKSVTLTHYLRNGSYEVLLCDADGKVWEPEPVAVDTPGVDREMAVLEVTFAPGAVPTRLRLFADIDRVGIIGKATMPLPAGVHDMLSVLNELEALGVVDAHDVLQGSIRIARLINPAAGELVPSKPAGRRRKG